MLTIKTKARFLLQPKVALAAMVLAALLSGAFGIACGQPASIPAATPAVTPSAVPVQKVTPKTAAEPPSPVAAKPKVTEKPRPLTAAEVAALPLGPDRQKILEEGAKQEGKLVIYGSDTGDMGVHFMKMYPFVKTQTYSAVSLTVVERARAEAQAGKLGGSLALGALSIYTGVQDILTEFKSPNAKFTVGPRGADVDYTGIAFVYHNERVKAADRPSHVNDLLSPRWKGKIGIFAPPNSYPARWTGMLLEYFGEAEGKNFLKKLGEQKPQYFPRSGPAYDAVFRGDIDITLSGIQTARELPTTGAPAAWVALEPTLLSPTTIGIFKDSPHPYAAMLFIDWMLSPEGNQAAAKERNAVSLKEIETRTTVDGFKLPKTVRVEKPEDEKNWKEWTRLFETLVMGK